MLDPLLDTPGFRHQALFYADDDEFLAGTVPFIREGLESGDAMLVALPRPRLEMVGDALAGAGERLLFADMERLGRNPARLIPAWRDFFDEQLAEGRSLRGIGEPVWPGRSAAEVDECGRHESLLNLAFSGAEQFSLMCPYDSARLDGEVLEQAACSHPFVSRHDCLGGSDSFSATLPDPFGGELDPAPADATERTFGVRELGDVRQFTAERGQAIGLEFSRIDDLVMAANELATNGLQHGEGKATIRIWRTGEEIACQVENEGRIEEPLAGRRRPDPDQPRGRGLWLVNQLCDLVQIRVGESGSVARLRMSLRGGPVL